MLDIALKLHGEVIDFWKFYLTYAVILLGWVFSRKEPWPWAQRLAIAIAFVGFVVFNLVGLVKSYRALGVVVSQIEILAKARNTTDAALAAMAKTWNMTDATLAAVVQRLDMGPWPLGIAFHIIVDAMVLYFILIWSGGKVRG